MHRLSAAARAFKGQALTAAADAGSVTGDRDVPLRCDGDAVGRRGSHSGELKFRETEFQQPKCEKRRTGIPFRVTRPQRSISTLPTAFPSATCLSARDVSASG